MKFSEHKTIDVVGVGNALMDILVEVSDDFLAEHKLTKGKMHLVSAEEAEHYLEAISHQEVRTLPGGATANTIRGVAALGGQTVFYGSVGTSMYGGMYREALKESGIDVRLHEGKELTGNAITYITPDHERTFTVHLGAASEFTPDLIDEEVIKAAKVVHLEAFQFEAGTKPVLDRVIELAKEYNTLVSLDLNDASLIERNFDLFQEVVENHVDILFANEDESAAFTGESDDQVAIEKMVKLAPISILKRGEFGSLVAAEGKIFAVDPVTAEVVDTTGAGDLYAAGFLYGLTQNWPISRASYLGSHLASAIISAIGVDVVKIDVPAILEQINE